jgi:hypothetical protein
MVLIYEDQDRLAPRIRKLGLRQLRIPGLWAPSTPEDSIRSQGLLQPTSGQGSSGVGSHNLIAPPPSHKHTALPLIETPSEETTDAPEANGELFLRPSPILTDQALPGLLDANLVSTSISFFRRPVLI